MKALFLSVRKLLPATGGAEIYSIGLLKYLNDIDVTTTVLSFYHENDYCDEEKLELLEYVDKLISVKLTWKNTALNISLKYPNNIRKYTRRSMMNVVKQELERRKYDVVISDHLHMFEYCKIAKKLGIRTILNTHNVEYKVWDNYVHQCRPLIRPFVVRTMEMTKEYEAQACRMADGVLAISETDKKVLNELEPNAKVLLMKPYNKYNRIKSGEDIRRTSNKVLFIGSYSWFPNQNAAAFLAEEVMPLLRKKKQGVKLLLVGNSPTQKMISYAQNNSDIVVTGRVESVDPYIKECDVFVNAVNDGGGMNIKMIEALGKGIPIVTSAFGLRGLEMGGKSMYMYCSAEQCVDQICELLENREKAKELADRGRYFYEEFIKPSDDVRKMIRGEVV